MQNDDSSNITHWEYFIWNIWNRNLTCLTQEVRQMRTTRESFERTAVTCSRFRHSNQNDIIPRLPATIYFRTDPGLSLGSGWNHGLLEWQEESHIPRALRTRVTTFHSFLLSSTKHACSGWIPESVCDESRCQQEQQQQNYVNDALHTGSPSISFNYLYFSSWFSWLQDVIKCSIINQAPSLPVLMRLYLQHPAF